ARVGAEPGAPLEPLLEAVVPPEVRVRRELADLDREGADETAEDLLLDGDPLLAVQPDELGELAGVDVVVPLLEDHPADSRDPAQTVRNASVGERRAARRAGRSPAVAPMTIAAPSPPPQASAGITTVQLFVDA